MAQGYQKIDMGKISLIYHQGFFRKFTLNSCEFLRGIYPAVRDQDWGTVPCVQTENLKPASSVGPLIKEKLTYAQGSIKLIAKITVDQIAENEWEFNFEGKAETDFYRNRIGWNVLLPIDTLAGQDFKAINTEKKLKQGIFPLEISPIQPIKNLKEIKYTDTNLTTVSIAFEGDVFEMEDQRNWTDASYKLYSTPLDLPFPVKVFAGDTITQSIRLSIKNQENAAYRKPGVHNKKGVVPTLGLGAVTTPRRYLPKEIEALKSLNIHFLSIHLRNNSEQEIARLKEHFRCCTQLGKKTAISFTLLKKEPVSPLLLNMIEENNKWVESFEIFDESTFLCSGNHVEKAMNQLKERIPDAKLGGGTFAYYAELNRAEKLYNSVDYMAFSVSPQVHAFDDLSIIENLEGISYVLQDAKIKFGKSIQLNALTLEQRMNFVATNDDDKTAKQEQFCDKRQNTVFAALWLLGALKRCALEKCAAVSMFETIGKRGVLEPGATHNKEENLVLFPVYCMIREVLKHAHAVLADMEMPDEMCEGMHILDKHGDNTWIWNYGDKPVQWDGMKYGQVEILNFKTGKWKSSAYNGIIGQKTLYQFKHDFK